MTLSNDSLTASDIIKTYGNRQVLRGISLYVKQGEVVGLFGPNGAGKTTCFNIVAGIIKADAGKLLFNKQEITNFPMYLRARIGISYLPQEASIFRGLSVANNLKAVLEIIGYKKAQITQKIDDLLREFSIEHLKHSVSTALSGGERRRLEIARTLAVNPKFVMLDEPLAGIDPIAIADIKYLITHLKKRNIGVLITDHNVRDTLDVVDRAYVIYDGQVLTEGTPERILSSDEVRTVYLGKQFMN